LACQLAGIVIRVAVVLILAGMPLGARANGKQKGGDSSGEGDIINNIEGNARKRRDETESRNKDRKRLKTPNKTRGTSESHLASLETPSFKWGELEYGSVQNRQEQTQITRRTTTTRGDSPERLAFE